MNYPKAFLKLLGDRVLFIVVSFVFLIPLTFISTLTFWNIYGVIYSVLTAIVYLSLIYYDMWDFGYLQRERKTGIILTAFIAAPTIIITLVLLIFNNGLANILFLGWNAVYCAPYIRILWDAELTLPMIYFFVPVILEVAFGLFAYYMGTKEIFPTNPIRKKLGMKLVSRKPKK